MPEKILYLDTILRQLTTAERDLFQRYCVQGESLAHISTTVPCSPETMRQHSCMLRGKLQTLLIEAGFSRKEAQDFLYQALTTHQ